MYLIFVIFILFQLSVLIPIQIINIYITIVKLIMQLQILIEDILIIQILINRNKKV